MIVNANDVETKQIILKVPRYHTARHDLEVASTTFYAPAYRHTCAGGKICGLYQQQSAERLILDPGQNTRLRFSIGVHAMLVPKLDSQVEMHCRQGVCQATFRIAICHP